MFIKKFLVYVDLPLSKHQHIQPARLEEFSDDESSCSECEDNIEYDIPVYEPSKAKKAKKPQIRIPKKVVRQSREPIIPFNAQEIDEFLEEQLPPPPPPPISSQRFRRGRKRKVGPSAIKSKQQKQEETACKDGMPRLF